MNELLLWYQNIPSKISPEIFSIGFFSVRWYGMGYILALFTCMILAKYRVSKNELDFSLSFEEVDKILLYCILAAVGGGRLGYVIFYEPGYYLLHPLEAILPFRFSNGIEFVGISGISYHGGFIAIILVLYYFARKKGLNFYQLGDFITSFVALGYTFGRLGNFMNGELYGRVTAAPWGMYFLDHNGIPFADLRHPSQLYEAFLEGIMVFAFTWTIRNRVPRMVTTGVYFIGYGVARSFVEFFRQPDAIFKNPGDDLGTVIGIFTMGQVLSSAMIIAGVYVIYLGYQKSRTQGVTAGVNVNPNTRKKK